RCSYCRVVLENGIRICDWRAGGRHRRLVVFFFQAEDGIRDGHVTGVQTCALPISWGMEGNNNPKGARPILPPRRARERQTGTKEIALTPVDQTTSDYASEFPSNRFCRR